MGADKKRAAAVGEDLLAVLPQDTRPWYTKRYLLRLNFSIASLIFFTSANGYDGSLMNGLQSLSQWQEFMDRPHGAWLGFMGGIYWTAYGINMLVVGEMANRIGRKNCIYVGYLWLILGVVLNAGNSDSYFVASRAFVGSASAWFASPVSLLINEIAYPTHRSIASALFNCGWYAGGTVGALVTYGTRNHSGNWAWRIPAFLQILIPICVLPGLLLAPESPRYLISKDRIEEARAILHKHHDGDNCPGLVEYEMSEITKTLQIERQASSSASYSDMTKTKGNRHRLLISISLGVFSQWTGVGVLSYYLPIVLNTVGVTSTDDQTLINVGMQIWNLIWASAAALYVDRLGRRFLFQASAIVMLIAIVFNTALAGSFDNTGNSATGLATIPFLFIFFAGYDISLTPLVISYPVECWQYSLRSRGLTVMSVSVAIANVFNQFVNPIALDAIGWKYYIVYMVIIIAYGLTSYFYYPETRGHTLEQMAVVFDGPDAAGSAELAKEISVGSDIDVDGKVKARTEHAEMV